MHILHKKKILSVGDDFEIITDLLKHNCLLSSALDSLFIFKKYPPYVKTPTLESNNRDFGNYYVGNASEIITAQNTDDVLQAIKKANKNNIGLYPRAQGHS